MSGNTARRRMTKFMPADFRLIEARQPPLKDQYDEWLARVICYAFSVPASAFVSQVNRATSETLRLQATQEGLVPLKAWIKSALDYVIQIHLGEPDLEFVWVGDDAVDPLQQAQTLNILVGAGIKTIVEARADLGLAPEGGKAAVSGLGKFNPYHDPSNGQFTTAGGAAAGSSDPLRPKLVADEKALNTTPSGFQYNDKIKGQMAARGWTPEQIDEAVKSGNRIDAVNKQGGNPATRYVSPSTGRSVVIDNLTGEVIQVGRDDFKFGPDSGDIPGAMMRPSPVGGGSTPVPVEPAPLVEPAPVPAEPILEVPPIIEP